MKMPFGKHRGLEIDELPDEYLAWLFENADLSGALQVCVENEYWARFNPEPPPPPKEVVVYRLGLDPKHAEVARKIVEAGYRSLSIKNHPDQGGSDKAMVAVNLAVEALRAALGKPPAGP